MAWRQHGIFMHVVDDIHATEHAGLQLLLRVFDSNSDNECTGCCIDHRADTFDNSRETLVGQGIHQHGGLLADTQLVQFAFRHVDFGAQRIMVGDAECRDVLRHHVADLDVTVGDDTGERRADFGEFELQAGEFHIGAHRFDFKTQAFIDIAADQLAVVQFLVAAEFLFELGEIGFGASEFQRQPVIIRLGENLPGCDLVALARENFLDHAADTGDDFRIFFGFEVGGTAVCRADGAAGNDGRFDRNDGFFGFLFRHLAGFTARFAACDQRNGEQHQQRKTENVFLIHLTLSFG